MDRVKFGRALGYGARHAARTLVQAADAAAAPGPQKHAPNPRKAAPSPQKTSPNPCANAASARQHEQAVQTAAARPAIIPDAITLRAAGRQARSSLVAPVVRFSSVISLQVSGVFFALIAFTMGAATWRARAGLHAAANSHAAIKLWAYLAVCGLFTYFTLSSFVRAARK